MLAELHALSQNQEAQWFLHQLAPDSAAYNTGVAVRIRSAVDVPALERAVVELGRRHDMLRSVFTEQDGQPVRLVDAESLCPLELCPLPGATVEELDAAVRARLRAPFLLADAGAFRIVLHTRAPEDSVLLIAGHHIATDAASDSVLLADLLELYRQIRAGGPVGLEPLADSYDEYVIKERRLVSSPLGAVLEKHWQDLCQGAAAVSLHPDRPRPARQSFTGDTCRVIVPAEPTSRLREVALESEVSSFAFLLAVFQGVLHRHIRTADFLIGAPVTTRLSSRSRSLVGNYINTIVFRAAIGGTTTFREAAVEANKQLKKAMAGLRYPFAHLARILAATREAGESAVYRVTFNMLATSHLPEPLQAVLDSTKEDEVSQYAGLRLSAYRLPQQEGQVDLGVDVLQTEDVLVVDFRYDSELYDRGTVEQFAAHFVRAVELATANPDTAVSRARIWGRATAAVSTV
ncbi:hypothetical protein P3T36_005709 [Kitasatospora sp. MAP12-15]|uniref:condensation domain-containing protein n=1 Tax=unclassified Kitasatospora TaxID=2633591 RepID=UPI00247420A3|nr:condensation domain-containing protein [Kitasatospora sp. MAP12-44]MDH6113779.1 hypothetical protein [Kitasatospora sp. MAP12-44]